MKIILSSNEFFTLLKVSNMAILNSGFKLFHPWVNDVVKGKLNFLVRSIPIKIRGRVAVISTNRIDKNWLENASYQEILKLKNKKGAIGSVEIKDCIEVKLNEVENQLIYLAGKKYWDYYPKHLIPSYTRIGKLYIWILDKPKEWKELTQVKSRGITWAKISLEDS